MVNGLRGCFAFFFGASADGKLSSILFFSTTMTQSTHTRILQFEKGIIFRYLCDIGAEIAVAKVVEIVEGGGKQGKLAIVRFLSSVCIESNIPRARIADCLVVSYRYRHLYTQVAGARAGSEIHRMNKARAIGRSGVTLSVLE